MVSAAPLERGLEEMIISAPRGAGGAHAKVVFERQRTAELAAVESRAMAASGRRTRQRPADILSPRRSFCDFEDLDLAPKKTRSGDFGNCLAGPDLNPLSTQQQIERENPALFAMRAKLAFIKACHAGDFEAVRRLVTRFGVSVKEECMALHFASDANFHEIVRFLIRQGASVDSRDSKNRTALMYASYKNNEETAAALLAEGASVELQDDFGSTALMYAASGGAVACCRMLEAGGSNLDMQNKDGLSALIYAIQSREHEAVRLLLELGANPYVTNCLGTGSLHWAAKKGDIRCVHTLLEFCVKVDAPNNKRVTPLMYAADCIPSDGSNVAVMRALIDAGADVRALDEDMSSPLMYAAHSGSEENIRLLLRRGADSSAENEFGTTPIMYAAYYGHLKALVAFLRHDPSLRLAKDKRGMAVRDWADQAKQETIVALLDRMEAFPLEWDPENHAEHPREIQDKVRAVLLAANSKDEASQLSALPSDILLKIIGQQAKLEMWPMFAEA